MSNKELLFDYFITNRKELVDDNNKKIDVKYVFNSSTRNALYGLQVNTIEELLKIIELENDEKEAGDMNLQVMLDRTDIVNHATPNTHVNNIDEIESIEI